MPRQITPTLTFIPFNPVEGPRHKRTAIRVTDGEGDTSSILVEISSDIPWSLFEAALANYRRQVEEDYDWETGNLNRASKHVMDEIIAERNQPDPISEPSPRAPEAESLFSRMRKAETERAAEIVRMAKESAIQKERSRKLIEDAYGNRDWVESPAVSGSGVRGTGVASFPTPLGESGTVLLRSEVREPGEASQDQEWGPGRDDGPGGY